MLKLYTYNIMNFMAQKEFMESTGVLVICTQCKCFYRKMFVLFCVSKFRGHSKYHEIGPPQTRVKKR